MDHPLLMKGFKQIKYSEQQASSFSHEVKHHVRRRITQWKQVRTWTCLIREAESFWYAEEREIRRLGAVELSQLLQEIPLGKRGRINRWLYRYSIANKFKGSEWMSGK